MRLWTIVLVNLSGTLSNELTFRPLNLQLMDVDHSGPAVSRFQAMTLFLAHHSLLSLGLNVSSLKRLTTLLTSMHNRYTSVVNFG